MTTWHQALHEGRRRLAGQEQFALLALNELAGQAGYNLYEVMEQEIDPAVHTDYLEAVFRLEQGEPLDYILGYTWFYSWKIGVDSRVLIPRPETEELVEKVLELADETFPDRKLEVFDIATGSGAIGIALAKEDPRFHVTATDISQDALDVARQNAADLEADVDFFQGDMLEPVIARGLHCDILVCNPPYIPDAEEVQDSVWAYEPHVALFGGADGLDFYRQVFAGAKDVLNPGGFLAFEMGWNQKEALTALARKWFPDGEIQVHKDINGKDRMLTVTAKGKKA